jgi:hypothetical protein
VPRNLVGRKVKIVGSLNLLPFQTVCNPVEVELKK